MEIHHEITLARRSAACGNPAHLRRLEREHPEAIEAWRERRKAEALSRYRRRPGLYAD